MTDERELHPSDDTKEPGRDYLWRVLKPGGCILLLLLWAAMIVFCFVYRPPAETEAPPAETAAAAPLAETGE